MNVYEEIIEILEKENIKYKKEELEKIVKFAEEKYVDVNKGNATMLEHVIGVAKEVALLRIDDVSVYAAILHGIVKCKDIDFKKLRKDFGNEIIDIIETADKLSCLNLKGKEKVDSEILRNMFLQDI